MRRRPEPFLRTTVLRLSAVYVVVFSLAVSLLLGLLYLYVVRALDRQTDELIQAELQGLAEQYSEHGLQGLAAVIEERARTAGRSGDVYLLADPARGPLAGNLAAWPGQGRVQDGWVEFEVSVERGARFEPHEVRAGLFALPGNYRLLVGTDVRERNGFKELIRWTVLWSVLLVIALGSLIGAWMNRRVLQHVDAITQAGSEIVNGNFSQRLPRSGSGDEFDLLAGQLNEMLDRIENLTTALRLVIDSTAHDLRSPLNRMRARIESQLPQISPSSCGEVLAATLQDAEQLQRALDALLRIAQARGGAGATEMNRLDLDSLAGEICELYEPLASDKGLDLRKSGDGPAEITGSRQLLAHAIANLVENAVKYTPNGGHVVVSTAVIADRVELTVADDGPGIPEADRARVLQRFVRLPETSRSPGMGLGLSLVEAVSRLHHARLSLEDNRPGLRVTISLAKAAPNQHS